MDLDTYPLSNLIRPRCAERAKPGRGTGADPGGALGGTYIPPLAPSSAPPAPATIPIGPAAPVPACGARTFIDRRT